MELVGTFTEAEIALLNELSGIECDNGLVVDTKTITKVTRRSDKEFDLSLDGKGSMLMKKEITIEVHKLGSGGPKPATLGRETPTTYAFSAWLPLNYISEFVDWCSPEIASMCDFPEMALNYDWSAIRDSDPETVWAIFHSAKEAREVS